MEFFLLLIGLIVIALWLLRRSRKTQDKPISPLPSSESPSQPSLKSRLIRVTKQNPNGDNRQDIIRSFCRPGMKVFVEHHSIPDYPDNLDVFIAPPEMEGELVQIGNIENKLSHDLAPRLDQGATAKFTIAEVIGGGTTNDGYEKYLGVNILIEPPDQ